VDIFLRGTRVEPLLNEITCGDVGLEGVKLVVPPDRFGLVVSRLKELISEPGGPKRLASFLSARCSVDFLRCFLEAEPAFIDTLKLGAWMLWSEEAKLFGILHQHRLLPKTQRRRFVVAARNFALKTPEWRFMLRPDFRSIFRPSELRSLRAAVVRKLDSANLKRETQWWKSRWDQDNDEDPDGYFWLWEQELEALAREFEDNRRVHRRYVVARSQLERMVEKLKRDWKKKDGDLDAASESQESPTQRSLFDDVDE